MTKMCLSLLFGFLFITHGQSNTPGAAVTILASTARSTSIHVRFDSISVVRVLENGEWLTSVHLKNAGSTIEPGAPRLPLVTVRLGIPADSRPSLKITAEEKESQHIGALKERVPASTETGAATRPSPLWYPESSAEIGLDAVIREQRVIFIHLFPVRYQANTGTAYLLKSIQLEIDFGVETASSTALPVEKTFESVFQDMLSNYESSRAWRRSSTDSWSLSKPTAGNQQPTARLLLKHAGVYGVTGRELASAGIDIRDIDPRFFSLTNKGVPVPIIIEGAGDGCFDYDDRIIFVGKANSGDKTHLSLFSDTNVYQLSWDHSGMAFTEVPAAPNGKETDILSTAPFIIHFEKDKRYERLVGYDNGDDDHWFWEKLMNGERINFPVHLPGLAAGSVLRLTAAFHGLSESQDVQMNHHVVAYFDAQNIGEAYGSGKTTFSLSSSSFTVHDPRPDRTIYFDLPLNNPAVFADFVYLNWFEIDYLRRLTAVNDELTFDLEPKSNRIWRLSGYTTDQVYLLTDNGYRLVHPKIKSDADGFDLLLTYPSNHPARLYAVAENALRSVESIEPDEPSNLSAIDNSADYVIISHRAFWAAAERLADYRARKGLRTLVADIQDVYDEFSYGLYDPRAIKRFIACTYGRWRKPAPLYFVLFGDTTYLMNKDVAAEAVLNSFVPSYMVNTKSFGMTSSDNYFACISGDDDLPDVYIGRLPANTQDEAETMVDKIITYETRGVADEWRRHITLASGNGDFFGYSAQYLVDHFLPKWMVTKRLSTDFESPFYNASEDFISWINEGQNIINFLVHGSGEQIADANLFEKDDIMRLANKDRYAFAVTMSCYIGHFDNPERHSLGEALFTAPNKGIMAMFGSAGKSYIYSDFYFNNAVFDGIYNKNWRTLGEITTNAKYELIAKTKNFWEPVQNFLLIGDPATELIIPEKKIDLTLSPKVLAEGDVLRVSGTAPGANGSLHLSAIGEMDSILADQFVQINESFFNVSLMTLTSQLRNKWGQHGGAGAVRAHFSDGQQHAVGLAEFSVIRPLIAEFGIRPGKPTGFAPVFFYAEIDADVQREMGGLESLNVEWSMDQAAWHNIPLQCSEKTHWISAEPLSHEEGTTIYYRLVITSQTGTRTETDVREYRVLYKPDIHVDADVRYFGAEESFLKVTIKNRGEADARDVSLAVSNVNTNQLLVQKLTIPLVRGREDTTIVVPIAALTAGTHDLVLSVDPENNIVEEEEENNTRRVVLHIVTPQSGSNNELLNLTNAVSLRIPAQGVSHSTSVAIRAFQDLELDKGAGDACLFILKIKSALQPTFFAIELADSTIRLNAATVALEPETSDSTTAAFLTAGGARIGVWRADSKSWKGVETTKQQELLLANLPTDAKICALFGSSDVEAPTITLSVQGQHFADGDVVPVHPVFNIALEDASTLDASSAGLQLRLDDRALAESDYVVAIDPHNAGLAHVSLRPDLTGGEHVLHIAARDAHGNLSSKEVSFRIAEKFGLDFIANHPNPFEDETTFVFNITDMASRVTLLIYTVSGRLIRCFEFTDITGYNEVDWDGADSDGNDVANGVYYLKFSAQHGDEKIERIERLAKLK